MEGAVGDGAVVEEEAVGGGGGEEDIAAVVREGAVLKLDPAAVIEENGVEFAAVGEATVAEEEALAVVQRQSAVAAIVEVAVLQRDALGFAGVQSVGAAAVEVTVLQIDAAAVLHFQRGHHAALAGGVAHGEIAELEAVALLQRQHAGHAGRLQDDRIRGDAALALQDAIAKRADHQLVAALPDGAEIAVVVESGGGGVEIIHTGGQVDVGVRGQGGEKLVHIAHMDFAPGLHVAVGGVGDELLGVAVGGVEVPVGGIHIPLGGVIDGNGACDAVHGLGPGVLPVVPDVAVGAPGVAAAGVPDVAVRGPVAQLIVAGLRGVAAGDFRLRLLAAAAQQQQAGQEHGGEHKGDETKLLFRERHGKIVLSMFMV